ncbi:MAG: hypothetical protein RPS47_03000, partial [Colwellia sp.]
GVYSYYNFEGVLSVVLVLFVSRVSYLVFSSFLCEDIGGAGEVSLSSICWELRERFKYFVEAAISVVSNNYDVVLLSIFIPSLMLVPYQANQKVYAALVPLVQIAFIVHYSRMCAGVGSEMVKFNITMYGLTIFSALAFLLVGGVFVGVIFGSAYQVSLSLLFMMAAMLVSKFLLARIGVILTACGYQGLKNKVFSILLVFQIILALILLSVFESVSLFVLLSLLLNFVVYIYLVLTHEKSCSVYFEKSF